MADWKVVLVDDEEEFVTTLAERLDLRGIEVQIATNGERALQIIENDSPDIVVLDVMMPGLGGLEVLQRIKAINSQISVILLTGHGSTEQEIETMLESVYDYLMKPLNIDELIKKMQEAINSR